MIQVLLDIGAGLGLFSLAAAARGHKAIAFELSGNSLASMEASIAFSGFQDLVTLHKVGAGVGAGVGVQLASTL